MAIRKLKTVSQEIKKQVVDCIRKVISLHDDILFSFIYGSFVDPEVADRYGDIDVAICPLAPDVEGKSYIFEARLEEEIMEELSANKLNLLPVEVINLKQAPYHLLASLFRRPYLMIKENEDIFTSLIEETSDRALANNHLRKESIREFMEADICQI